jgi:hypothetical protein
MVITTSPLRNGSPSWRHRPLPTIVPASPPPTMTIFFAMYVASRFRW